MHSFGRKTFQQHLALHTLTFPAQTTPIIMPSSQEQLLMYKSRQDFQKSEPWLDYEDCPEVFRRAWLSCPWALLVPWRLGTQKWQLTFEHIGCGCYIPCYPMPCILQVEKIYLPEQNLLDLCLYKEIKNSWSKVETIFEPTVIPSGTEAFAISVRWP